MTLILSLITSDQIVHVSDVRLVATNKQEKQEDLARKIIFFSHDEAEMVVSYAGLATLWEGNSTQPVVPIEKWLMDHIGELSTKYKFYEMCNKLAERLDKAITGTIQRYSLTEEEQKIWIIFVGYQFGRIPTIFCLSNTDLFAYELMSVPVSYLSCAFPIPFDIEHTLTFGKIKTLARIHQSPGTMKPTIFAHGDISACQPSNVNDFLRTIQKRGAKNPTCKTLTSYLVSMLKHIAEHTKSNTISKNCWSACTAANSTINEFNSHFENAISETIQPSWIMPYGSLQWRIVEQTADKLAESYREKILLGELNIRIDEHSLRAYIDYSENFDKAVELARRSGFEISSVYGLQDTLKAVVNCAGISKLSYVDQLVSSSLSWAQDFWQEDFSYARRKYQSMLPELPENPISHDRSSILFDLIVANNLEIFGRTNVKKQFLYDDDIWKTIEHISRLVNPKYKHS